MSTLLLDFVGARAAFQRGENVAGFLRKEAGMDQNTPEIIEMAYDLQAGSYIAEAVKNPRYLETYTDELSEILNVWLRPGDSILDVGTGELTTLTYLVNKISVDVEKIYAFDISWSRLALGVQFAKSRLKYDLQNKLWVFSADIHAIPLMNNSIDIVISNHALEPNGGKETYLLRELIRVARRKLVLFEPSYEYNSPEGKERMVKHGYIRGLPEAIASAGGRLLDFVMIKSAGNSLNPTAAYIIDTDKDESTCPRVENEPFSDPGSNSQLRRLPDCYFSPQNGVAYPIFGEIPILRSKAAILTSAMVALT